jgi:hypothetical protein
MYTCKIYDAEEQLTTTSPLCHRLDPLNEKECIFVRSGRDNKNRMVTLLSIPQEEQDTNLNFQAKSVHSNSP